MSLAPRLASKASAGQSPTRKLTMTSAPASRAWPSPAKTPQCSKREPLGPGLDFLGNLLMAFLAAFSSSSLKSGVQGSGSGVPPVARPEPGGSRASRAPTVSLPLAI